VTDGDLAPRTLALIAAGGVAGALSRYAVGRVLPLMPATLAVNVVGSLVLGFVLYESIHLGAVPRQLRLVIATGFLSSLTTYSTFALQTADASPALAVGNVGANYALGFLAIAIGRRTALRVAGGRNGGDVVSGDDRAGSEPEEGAGDDREVES
jgi:CrcB protein